MCFLSSEIFFRVLSFSYLQHSCVLWVAWTHQLLLHSMQCYSLVRCIFGIVSGMKPSSFWRRCLTLQKTLALHIPYYLLKVFSICSMASKSFQTLWATCAPLSLYLSCQIIVTFKECDFLGLHHWMATTQWWVLMHNLRNTESAIDLNIHSAE